MIGKPAAPLRVGFVVHVMQVAGAEVLVWELIHRLAGRIRPFVLCLDAVGSLGERLRAEGVEVICLDRRAGLDLAVARRTAAAVQRYRIDVLHAHQYTPFFYSALARMLCRDRPPLIFTEHGRHYPDIVSARRRVMNRLVFSHIVDEVTAVCEFSANSLMRLDGFAARRIRVIENGIDETKYSTAHDRAAARQRIGLDPSHRAIANIARFHPVKDQATLISAFSEIAGKRPDVDLVLVGDGPLRSSLEQRVRSLSIESRVRFLGVRHDVPQILQAVDIFALTSVSEAASITLLEAMASGVPAVVTAVGGNPELVRDGVEGFLVPRGDIHATTGAMLRLLDDAEMRKAMGEAAAERVRQKFRLTDTVERYYSLYTEVAST